jgi:hypothetical protein
MVDDLAFKFGQFRTGFSRGLMANAWMFPLCGVICSFIVLIGIASGRKPKW